MRGQKRPDDQTGEVKPRRGSHDQPRVRTPRERQGRSQSELKPWRELEDPTLMGTSKVSSRDGATGSDSNTDRSRGVRKANSQTRDSAEATELNLNGVNETHPPRGEETITSR